MAVQEQRIIRFIILKSTTELCLDHSHTGKMTTTIHLNAPQTGLRERKHRTIIKWPATSLDVTPTEHLRNELRHAETKKKLKGTHQTQKNCGNSLQKNGNGVKCVDREREALWEKEIYWECQSDPNRHNCCLCLKLDSSVSTLTCRALCSQYPQWCCAWFPTEHCCGKSHAALTRNYSCNRRPQ